MSMDTNKDLKAAEQQLVAAQERVERLRRRKAFEESFNLDGNVYVVTRRSIDSGRFEAIEGVFEDAVEAGRFAGGLPGYGVGHDIFVDSFPFYRKG